MTETRSPEELRSDIEATREQLGDTVAGLAEKADVKAQARHILDDARANLSRAAHEKPLPFVLAGVLGSGLLLGRVLARRED